MMEKVELIVSERRRMVAELAKFDYLQPFPSRSNFVLLASGPIRGAAENGPGRRGCPGTLF